MNTHSYSRLLKITLISITLSLTGNAQALTSQEQFGKAVYFDSNLSEPAGQACASCHDPATGFAEPDQDLPVSEGVIPGRFGGRNAPSASYAVFFEEFDAKNVRGGQFWDGRAANLTEQAKGPFLNPVEMNNSSPEQVVQKIAASAYADLLVSVCGQDAALAENTATTYHCIASAIAAYEGTTEVNPFSSRYDCVKAGKESFSAVEARGFKLFKGAGKCSNCHSLGGRKSPDLFMDQRYHNLGLPKNTDYPFTGNEATDLGVGVTVNDPKEYGKFKTEHLRNIAMSAPYMHNGVLKTLKDVVHFYNTRDVPGLWPAPEYPDTMDGNFMGDLGLNDADENAIVAFMETLTDGYSCTARAR
ncbi:MAG: cytochrome-c peroxidase [Gammaproteobacteria bacterium]|nr:cytochrome-c peroxidase [Gammaproteobacteria bacterium]